MDTHVQTPPENWLEPKGPRWVCAVRLSEEPKRRLRGCGGLRVPGPRDPGPLWLQATGRCVGLLFEGSEIIGRRTKAFIK